MCHCKTTTTYKLSPLDGQGLSEAMTAHEEATYLAILMVLVEGSLVIFQTGNGGRNTAGNILFTQRFEDKYESAYAATVRSRAGEGKEFDQLYAEEKKQRTVDLLEDDASEEEPVNMASLDSNSSDDEE